MKILVACEESQAVCIELRALGHEAYSCDILPCSGGHPEWHIQGDVLKTIVPSDWGYGQKQHINFVTQDGTYHILDENGWHMMIAFPPCTHLSSSGARHFAKKIADGRQQQGIDFFMTMVNAPIPKIAIENPIGVMSSKYRKPDQIIQPRQFGDEAQKSTCLWLKGLPLLTPTNIVGKGEFVTFPSGKRHPKRYSNKAGKGGERSKTFPGIAKAMATQRTQ